MNSESIKTFLTLADTGSGTKAAHQLSVTQSAVSKRIKDLEEELKVKLFVWDKKQFVLTPAGRTFYEYAFQIIQLQEEASQEVLKECEESLIIGCVDSLHDCHVGHLMAAFSRRYCHISVKLVIDHSQFILNDLYDGKLDICFS